MVSFRDAAVSDLDWLFGLKRDTIRPYVEATWGNWDDAGQRARFVENFQPNGLRVLQQDGRDVGVLDLRDEGDEIFLADIAVAPGHQNRGIGREVIAEVLRRASEAGKTVRLQVLKANPARCLYERLGFTAIAGTETHYIMKHGPTPVS